MMNFKDCQDEADKLQINYMLIFTFSFCNEMKARSQQQLTKRELKF